MFDRRITTRDAAPSTVDDAFASVRTMLDSLADFAGAQSKYGAPQHGVSTPEPHSIAARYAAANSITRRRFDAMLRETETSARMGFGLMAARSGRTDAGTIAAARFLGNSLTSSLRRLDNLLARHPA